MVERHKEDPVSGTSFGFRGSVSTPISLYLTNHTKEDGRKGGPEGDVPVMPRVPSGVSSRVGVSGPGPPVDGLVPTPVGVTSP